MQEKLLTHGPPTSDIWGFPKELYRKNHHGEANLLGAFSFLYERKKKQKYMGSLEGGPYFWGRNKKASFMENTWKKTQKANVGVRVVG